LSVSSFGATESAGGRGDISILRIGGLVGAAVLLGLLTGDLALSGHGALVFAFGAVAVFVVLWQNPALAPAALLAAVLSIEQFPIADGPAGGVLTDKIPLFRGLSQSLHVNTADLVLLALSVLCVLRSGTGVTRHPPRSAVSAAMSAVVAATLLGLFVGRLHHGNLRTSLTEVRPYVYLTVAYALTTAFAAKRQALRAVLWAIVVLGGLKSVQTIYFFIKVRALNPRPQAILGHEEALFYGLTILLVFALWLFNVRGRLRTTGTYLLPLVITANLVNGRRAAWLIVGACLVVLIVIGLVALPRRRVFLGRFAALLLTLSAVYFPLYWHHNGGFAQPARALRSAVNPDSRDSLSDLYRVQENANLKVNIREGGILGRGFGVPIDYPLPITDLKDIDPLIAYIPHDGVFYILMRMGLFGGVAFWSLLGAGIIGGARLARSRDRELASFGAFLACAIVGYALEGYNDQGFFFYRIAVAMGILFGLGEAARRFDREQPADAPAAARQVRVAVAAPVPVAVAAAAAPTTAVAPPRPVAKPKDRADRERFAQLAAACALPFAIALGIWMILHKPTTTHTVITQRATPAVVRSARHGARLLKTNSARSGTQVASAEVATLSISDALRPTWVELRNGSAHGRILFAGEVEPGTTLRYRRRAIWVRFGAAANLRIVANGVLRPLSGTADFAITPKTVRMVP
jgi:hypothetical protein